MKEKLMEAFELPKELFTDIPKLTWLGKTDLTCENCGGLITCDETLIRFATAIGILTITGTSLAISGLSDHLAIIVGNILEIHYE